MHEVDIKKGEPIDRALKRLKSKLETEGIMDEMRRLRSFETPAQKTKRKARANAKRNKNKRQGSFSFHAAVERLSELMLNFCLFALLLVTPLGVAVRCSRHIPSLYRL